jgi:hypothetical protein
MECRALDAWGTVFIPRNWRFRVHVSVNTQDAQAGNYGNYGAAVTALSSVRI